MTIDVEFLKAAGTAFGLVAGGAVVGLAFKIGISWNDLRRDAREGKACALDTQQTLNADISPRLQRLEQTLHGPEGNNGLYQTVRDLDSWMRSKRVA